MGEVRLHKEFGVNPTIPICIYCGEDKNEVALLGAAYKDEAPMHMAIDQEPCDECKKKIDSGEAIGFIAECGHSGLIHRKAFLETISSPELAEQIKDASIIRMELCFECMSRREKKCTKENQ